MTTLDYIPDRKPRNMSEDSLQKAVVKLLRASCKPTVYWTAINPGGDKKSKATAARHKALGLRAGAPDMMFVLSASYAAFMEFKAPRGRLSPEQAALKTWCEDRNVPYAVVQTFDQAVAILTGWGVIKGAK